MTTPFPMEILQLPEQKRIVMIYEGGTHIWRVIYMDGRAASEGRGVEPDVAGPFGRALGGRHAGRRCRRLQRGQLDRHGRRSAHRSTASRGTLHPQGSLHAALRSDHRRSGRVHRALDRRLRHRLGSRRARFRSTSARRTVPGCVACSPRSGRRSTASSVRRYSRYTRQPATATCSHRRVATRSSHAASLAHDIDMLGDVLHAVVHDGAGVSFIVPFSLDEGRAFWLQTVLPNVRARTCRVLVARQDGAYRRHGAARIPWPPNQPHRGGGRQAAGSSNRPATRRSRERSWGRSRPLPSQKAGRCSRWTRGPAGPPRALYVDGIRDGRCDPALRAQLGDTGPRTDHDHPQELAAPARHMS